MKKETIVRTARVLMGVSLAVFSVMCYLGIREVNRALKEYHKFKLQQLSMEASSASRRALDTEKSGAETRRVSDERGKLEEIVEREIRKNDPWVEEVFAESRGTAESAASQPAQQARVQLRRHWRSSRSVAAYSPQDDVLIVFTDSGHEDIAGAIDHELWHAFFDSEGAQGFYFRSGVSAPSSDEVSSYTLRRAADPAFGMAALLQAVSFQSSTLLGILRKGRAFCTNAVVTCGYDFANVIERNAPESLPALNEKRTAWRSALKANEEWFSERMRKFEERWDSECVPYAASGNRPLRTDTIRLVQEWTALIRDVTQEARLRFGEGVRIVREAGAFLAEAGSTRLRECSRAFEVQLDHELGALESRAIHEGSVEAASAISVLHRNMSNARDALFAVCDLAAIQAAANRECEQLGEEIRSFDGQFCDPSDAIDLSGEIISLPRDANEVMARIVDSLYSLYFGPVDFNLLPLGEADLAFLERFTYRGAPIFRKGIEKYRLGLELIRGGMAPGGEAYT